MKSKNQGLKAQVPLGHVEHKGILTRVETDVQNSDMSPVLTDDAAFPPLSLIQVASVCLLEDRLTKTMTTILYCMDNPAH